MGIIKAAVGAVGGALADQWLEVVESGEMSDTTVFCEGVLTRRGQNVRGTARTVSNGSKIRVYPNQFMMLVEGGKIVDYTAEEGYYTVSTSSLPTLFNGQFGDALKETFAVSARTRHLFDQGHGSAQILCGGRAEKQVEC